MTVVVEVDDGSLRSGSAVVAGGRAFGVARATWRALGAAGLTLSEGSTGRLGG